MSQRETTTEINPEAVSAARSVALPEEQLLAMVQVFRSLADPTRAQILHVLAQQPLCVRDLSILIGISESGVSHQLRFLRDQHLVKPCRDGNVIYYSVDDRHVAALFREADYHVDHVRRGLPDHPYPLP